MFNESTDLTAAVISYVHIDMTIFLIMFLVSALSTALLFMAYRRFVHGEFKTFVMWIVAASFSFMISALMLFFHEINIANELGKPLLMASGLFLVLTSLFFAWSTVMLHQISKTYGFRHKVDKMFEKEYTGPEPKHGKKK